MRCDGRFEGVARIELSYPHTPRLRDRRSCYETRLINRLGPATRRLQKYRNKSERTHRSMSCVPITTGIDRTRASSAGSLTGGRRLGAPGRARRSRSPTDSDYARDLLHCVSEFSFQASSAVRHVRFSVSCMLRPPRHSHTHVKTPPPYNARCSPSLATGIQSVVSGGGSREVWIMLESLAQL
jgi:hypothetical protein